MNIYNFLTPGSISASRGMKYIIKFLSLPIHVQAKSSRRVNIK